MFLLLLLKLILGVGEWVGCEEAVDGCWCWWVGVRGGGY